MPSDSRHRVSCPTCEYTTPRTYPNALVADAEAQRHDERVHEGEPTAVVERVTAVADGGRRIEVEDLTDEQIERVLNSRGFQKMLAYNKLADGIEVLEDEDEIFTSMVSTITKQHSSVSTEASVREVLRLFREEIETFTEPLVDETGEPIESDDLEDLYVTEADR